MGKTNLEPFYTLFDLYLERLSTSGVQFYFVTITDVVDIEVLIECLNGSVELIEFSYLSMESNHIYGFIGIRSLIGKNPTILLNLKDHLFIVYKDIQIYEVHDLRRMFHYTVKKHQFEHQYVTFHVPDNDLTAKMLDEFIVLELSSLRVRVLKNQWNQIPHFQGSNVLINLFNLYFHLEDLVIFNHGIYKKREYIGNLEYLKYHHQIIIETVVKEFPMQLKDYRFPIHTSLYPTIELIEKIPTLLRSKNRYDFSCSSLT